MNHHETRKALGIGQGKFTPFGRTRDKIADAFRCDDTGAIFLGVDVEHKYESAIYAPKPLTNMMRVDNDRRRELLRRIAARTTRPGDMPEGTMFDPFKRVSLGNRRVLDYGCGNNELLAGRYPDCHGYDPSNSECNEMPEGSFDIISAFHVIEHCSGPIDTLTLLRPRLRMDGYLVVEVPHANDWLLHNCPAFRSFSLWSQHLILHTRETLEKLLTLSGYRVESITPEQRYPLSNHLSWLTKGVGVYIERPAVDVPYAEMLAETWETDTLIAIAKAVS